jgi:hypothetical protein
MGLADFCVQIAYLAAAAPEMTCAGAPRPNSIARPLVRHDSAVWVRWHVVRSMPHAEPGAARTEGPVGASARLFAAP